MDNVAIDIPQTLYSRLEKVAARMHKPVPVLLAETLQAALPQFEEEVPESIRAEVATLADLDEVALRELAISEMADEEQQALEQLLDLQSMRLLSDEELARLEALRLEYGRILLRKARAFALLAERDVPMDV
jgi:lipoate-protein ligase A